MHDLAFADAARPTPVRILGLPLRDYSLGHELHLLCARNVLLCSPADFSSMSEDKKFTALVHALLVCSRDWVTNNKAARGEYREPMLRLWLWSVRRRARKQLDQLASAFLGYRNAALSSPPIAPSKPSELGRELGSPSLAHLYNQVRDWDCPFGLAIWLRAAALESKGELKVANESEAETAAEIERIKAEVSAEIAARDGGGDTCQA